MASLNKVQLIGNLGADPVGSATRGGTSCCNFSVATTQTWKDKDGQKQERTDWHRVAVYGRLAETCTEYLSKGRSVYVEGRIQTREYEKNGVTHYATDIVAEEVQFLSNRKSQRNESEAYAA